MDSFVGEIRILPYTFPPDQWSWCNGQQVAISQNQALYAVIGLTYGGDGKTYFNLPNLTIAANKPGSTPVGTGSGPGLTPRSLNKNSFGVAAVQLQLNQTPAHNHAFMAQNTTVAANIISNPTAAWLARGVITNPQGGFVSYAAKDPAKQVAFRSPALSIVGSDPAGAHNNMQPYLTMNFCISLAGEFPLRP